MKSHYIHATLELLATHDDVAAVFGGLQKTLEARGHSGLYAAVLRGVLRHLEGETRGDARIYLARETDAAILTSTIEAHLKTLGSTGEQRTIIDPSLVGGVVVEKGHQRIDASYKRALKDLFERITD